MQTWQRKITADASGFTLLEVMIAVAIIGISFVSLLGAQSQSISIAEISRFETIASMLARQKLAEIQLSNFEDLFGDSGDFEDDFADYHWQSEITELGEDEIGIEGADGMLKQVDLIVSRGEDEDMVFQIRTLFMAAIEGKKK